MLGHSVIGAQHIALGILAVGAGTAARILPELGVLPEDVAAQIEKRSRGSTMAAPRDRRRLLPLSAEGLSVLEMSVDEADSLGSQSIGTEHLLLAMLREGGSVAASVFAEFKVRYRDVRQRVPRSADSARKTPRWVSGVCAVWAREFQREGGGTWVSSAPPARTRFSAW